MSTQLSPRSERQLRQVLFMLVAWIADTYGPAIAARVVAGLSQKYQAGDPPQVAITPDGTPLLPSG